MAIEYPIKQNGHFTLEKLSADHLLPLIDRFLLTFILISLENVKTKLIQKSALILNSFSSLDVITPAFWYSPTLLSKKLVFP